MTIAVRWLHSLVTDMTPSTGSRMPIGMLAPALKESNVDLVVLGEQHDELDRSAPARSAPAIEISSQRPARVSTILRSSTQTSRRERDGAASG